MAVRKKKTVKKAKAGKTTKRVAKKAAKKTVAKKAKKKKAVKAKAAKRPAAKKARVAKKAKKKAPAERRGEYGEGNYKASKRFRQAEEKFIAGHRAEIPALGKAAEDALDGPEGDALRAAEAEAAGHAAGRGE